jgi:YfiH family protein
LRQEHGATAVVVDEPGDQAGARADAAVTAVPGAVLAVTVADCAPVALLAERAVGVVHVGWRGLLAGVIPAAVDALRCLDGGPVRAVIGPSIRPPCYEFGDREMVPMIEALGEGVRAQTPDGRTALDVAAGVLLALAAAGVTDCIDSGLCTTCSPGHWSHRGRGDRQRHALVAALAS